MKVKEGSVEIFEWNKTEIALGTNQKNVPGCIIRAILTRGQAKKLAERLLKMSKKK